jgi:hypothetical protein
MMTPPPAPTPVPAIAQVPAPPPALAQAQAPVPADMSDPRMRKRLIELRTAQSLNLDGVPVLELIEFIFKSNVKYISHSLFFQLIGCCHRERELTEVFLLCERYKPSCGLAYYFVVELKSYFNTHSIGPVSQDDNLRRSKKVLIWVVQMRNTRLLVIIIYAYMSLEALTYHSLSRMKPFNISMLLR